METTTATTLDALLVSMDENEVMTTREFAARLAVSTPAAYKLLCEAEKTERVSKYGYRVRGGWEDSEHTTRKCDSLGWQVNK